MRQFESQIQPLKSWMNKVLPTLDDSEPVYGDVATVHELTDDHEVYHIRTYYIILYYIKTLYYIIPY